MGVHESQSRIYENQIGRSRAFTEYLYGRMRDSFGDFGCASAEDFYRAVNRLDRGYIRTEADEVQYNLHVMLRFDLERAMIAGDLAIKDLPGAWNERFKDMLGVDVPDDAHGCLQDVHWSFGLFGYFPTYTLGNLYAAQFFEKIREEMPDLDSRIAEGDIRCVLDWMRGHVHEHGRRFTAAELCEKATGKALSPEPLMKYLEGKLRPVYGI